MPLILVILVKCIQSELVFFSIYLFTVSQVDEVIVKDQDVGSIPSVDVDVVGGNLVFEKDVSDPTLGTSEGKFDNEEDPELETSEQSRDTSGVVPSPEMSQTDLAPAGSPSSVL